MHFFTLQKIRAGFYHNNKSAQQSVSYGNLAFREGQAIATIQVGCVVGYMKID
jgi:hypothetical protein